MRWQRLFDDLEAQLARLEALERTLEVAEHTRSELGQVELLHRVTADLGRRLRLRVAGHGWVEGRLADVGTDWVLVEPLPDIRGGELLVPAGALRAVTGLSGQAELRQGVASRRFDIRRAVRALARDRAVVTATDLDGERVTGTIDAALADHLDLAEHAEGEPRRAGSVRARVSLPYAALASVRRL